MWLISNCLQEIMPRPPYEKAEIRTVRVCVEEAAAGEFPKNVDALTLPDILEKLHHFL
jgi:hypothetical protein